MSLHLNFLGDTPLARRHLPGLIALAKRVIDVQHDLPIIVAPAITVGLGRATNGYSLGFGAFRVYNGTADIWLAGDLPEDFDRRSARYWYASTLFHELVHYEQWRDGKEVQERGVEVRARNLMKRVGIEVPGWVRP